MSSAEHLTVISIPRMFLIHIRPENEHLAKVAKEIPLAHRGYAKTEERTRLHLEPHVAAALLKHFGPEIVLILNPPLE